VNISKPDRPHLVHILKLGRELEGRLGWTVERRTWMGAEESERKSVAVLCATLLWEVPLPMLGFSFL
jgi:hypothetical protein